MVSSYSAIYTQKSSCLLDPSGIPRSIHLVWLGTYAPSRNHCPSARQMLAAIRHQKDRLFLFHAIGIGKTSGTCEPTSAICAKFLRKCGLSIVLPTILEGLP